MNTLNGAAALRAAQEKLARQTPGSGDLYERSRREMPGGVTSNIRYAAPHPLYVRDARGARHSFLSSAHGDAEIGAIVQGYDRSIREIQAAA